MIEDEIKKSVDYEKLKNHLKGEDPISFAMNAKGCAKDINKSVMDYLEKLIQSISATNKSKASGFFVIFMVETLLLNFKHFYTNMSYAIGPKEALGLMYDHLAVIKESIEDCYKEDLLKEKKEKNGN